MLEPVMEELNATSLPAVSEGSKLVETSDQVDPRVAMALGGTAEEDPQMAERLTTVMEVASELSGSEGSALVMMLSEILTEQYARLTGVPELTYERLTELAKEAEEAYKGLNLAESEPLPDTAPAVFYLFPQFVLHVVYARAEAEGATLQVAIREGFERFAAATKSPATFATVKSARVIDPNFSVNGSSVALRLTLAVELSGTVGELKSLLQEIPLEYNRLSKAHHEAKHGAKPSETPEPASAAPTANVEG